MFNIHKNIYKTKQRINVLSSVVDRHENQVRVFKHGLAMANRGFRTKSEAMKRLNKARNAYKKAHKVLMLEYEFLFYLRSNEFNPKYTRGEW